MQRWSLPFLIMALFAGLFGFVGVADYSWEGGKVLCVIFFILAILTLVGGAFGRRRSWRE